MFYILETKEKVSDLFNSIGETSSIYISVIPYHDNYHPALQDACMVYIRPLESHKGYIVPINHSEALQVEKEYLEDILLTKSFKNIFCLDSKFNKYFFRTLNTIDLSLYVSLENKKINLENSVSLIKNNFYKAHKRKDANFYLPLSKLYEEKDDEYEEIQSIVHKLDSEIDSEKNSYFKALNQLSPEIFYLLESKGIRIEKEAFKKHFSHIKTPAYNLHKGIIYSHYNIYNYTGRPTNSFNGINFAALNKDNGERSALVPKNDIFMDLDFSSYHVLLISKMIGYQFTSDDIHSELGRMYFGKDELTPEEYDKSKSITFSNIYGGVKKDYLENPFFVKLTTYINDVFSHLSKNGEYLFEITGRIYRLEHLGDTNPTKFFNYLLQGLESFMNLFILNKFFSILNGKKTGLVLYLYDSFLFDLDMSEKDALLVEIQEILNNSIAYKVKYGKNYNDLGKL